MEMKSILEKTNSWKPFLEESKSARLGKDYRHQTLKKILSIIDPEISLWPGSIWKALTGFLIGPGFQTGRTLSFYEPCKRFLDKNKKVFIDAPLKVIIEFNALMSFLFSEKDAAMLHLDEKLARRKLSAVEKALEEGKKGRESLTKLITGNKKFLAEMFASPTGSAIKETEKKRTPQETVAPSSDTPIFSTVSPLDDEAKHNILSILSEASLSYEQENRPTILDRKIIKLLEEGIGEYKNTSHKLRISFSSPNIVPFKDLLSQTQTPGKLPLNKDFLVTLFSQKDDIAAASLIKAHTQEILTPLITVKKQAENRAKRLNFIDQEKKRLLHLIEPFTQKKDVRAKAEILISELFRIEIPDFVYQGQSSDKIEQDILEKEQDLKTVSQKLEEQFKELLIEIRVRTEAADRFIFTLCTSLYEIVSAHTPYPDLLQTTMRVRNNLLKDLFEIRHSFVEGNINLADCKDQMVDCSFTPDVRLIRGEIASRSYRLSDLKKRILNELYSLDFMICMTGLAKTLNKRLLDERQWLYQFLEKLLNPFPLFIDAFNPDSINIVFRYWWEDFERFLQTKSKRKNEYIATVLPIAESIHRPILRTLDIIDKIEVSKTSKKYAAFTEKIQNKKGNELVNACEQYFANHRMSLIENFVPQLCSIPGREQEPIIEQLLQLEDRIAEITTIARDLQAIKTYENERIDSILDIFSQLSIVPSFDVPTVIRLKSTIAAATETISKVEETLLIELGVLSKKARIEQGNSLTNLLPKILLCIPAQIDKKIESLKSLTLSQNPYISSLSHHLLADAYRLQQSLGEVGFNCDKVFEFVQEIALLFMHVKLLFDAQDQENFSSILLLATATQHLTECLRKEHKKQNVGYSDLISHLESLYFSPLEIVNPDDISVDDFSHKLEEYVHTATRLITLLNLIERRENQLLSGIKNVLHMLSQIILVKKIPELTYIPGCMNFFTLCQGRLC